MNEWMKVGGDDAAVHTSISAVKICFSSWRILGFEQQFQMKCNILILEIQWNGKQFQLNLFITDERVKFIEALWYDMI